MSDKTKFPRGIALAVGEWLVNELAQFCEPERITICGSIRRGKPMVGDIEIAYVPKIGTRQADLLTTEEYSIADYHIDRMLGDGILTKRPNKIGAFTWGEKNKLAIHVKSGIPVDFFAEPDPRCWFRTLVIRTGGAGTNKMLTTSAMNRRRKLHAYGSGCLEDFRNPSTFFPGCESEVFSFCGVEYKEPKDRM